MRTSLKVLKHGFKAISVLKALFTVYKSLETWFPSSIGFKSCVYSLYKFEYYFSDVFSLRRCLYGDEVSFSSTEMKLGLLYGDEVSFFSMEMKLGFLYGDEVNIIFLYGDVSTEMKLRIVFLYGDEVRFPLWR